MHVSASKPKQSKELLNQGSLTIRHENITIHKIDRVLNRTREIRLQNRTMFNIGNSPPYDISRSDMQFLHELELRPYIPKWIDQKESNSIDTFKNNSVKEKSHRVLLPTVRIKCNEQIPDSCPTSPLILTEVPDSEEEVS
mgnify:CR=1 FL=1